jgi:hypothetical protein
MTHDANCGLYAQIKWFETESGAPNFFLVEKSAPQSKFEQSNTSNERVIDLVRYSVVYSEFNLKYVELCNMIRAFWPLHAVFHLNEMIISRNLRQSASERIPFGYRWTLDSEVENWVHSFIVESHSRSHVLTHQNLSQFMQEKSRKNSRNVDFMVISRCFAFIHL